MGLSGILVKCRDEPFAGTPCGTRERVRRRRRGHAPLQIDDEAALAELALRIKAWGRELGFAAVGVSDADLTEAEEGLASWLEAGYHGEMDYMAKHGMKRARPAELVAGTRRVITVRMAYLPASTLDGKARESAATADGQAIDWRAAEWARIGDPAAAVVSVYARGRDYHKVMRSRLQQLADRIEARDWRVRVSRIYGFRARSRGRAGAKSG